MKNKNKTNKVKNVLSSMIKHISVIAVVLAIGLIALLYIGPEIKFDLNLVFKMAVPSIVLAISITAVYELWLSNGRTNAREEPDYINLLNVFATKSDNLHYPTLQDFLDYESARRYTVEYDRLSRILERETNLVDKMAKNPNLTKIDKLRLRWSKRRIIKWTKQRDNIQIVMPYDKSEEFDYLRYNLEDVVYKEYSPNDTKRHLAGARTRKYVYTFTFAIVGLNFLSIGSSMTGNLWHALIMTLLAAVSILYSVISGFSVGYKNIKVYSTGVYKTAVSFLDQAVAYSKRESKELYYNGPTVFREASPIVDQSTSTEPDESDSPVPEEDIFAKVAREVTEA